MMKKVEKVLAYIIRGEVEHAIGCFDWIRRDRNEIHRRHVFLFQAVEAIKDEWVHSVTGHIVLPLRDI